MESKFIISIIVVIIIVIIVIVVFIPPSVQIDSSSEIQSKGVNEPVLTYNRYKGGGSGRCLTIDANGGNNNGTILMQYDCGSGDNQKFYYNPSTQEIKIKSSNKCIDITGNTGNGGGIQQNDCDQNSNQQWTYVNNTFKNVNAGRCMTVHNASHDNNTPIILWDCDIAAPQELWTVV